MPDLLWQAMTVQLNSRYPITCLANALNIPRDVAALVLDAIRTPTTAQVDRDRHLTRNRVMP